MAARVLTTAATKRWQPAAIMAATSHLARDPPPLVRNGHRHRRDDGEVYPAATLPTTVPQQQLQTRLAERGGTTPSPEDRKHTAGGKKLQMAPTRAVAATKPKQSRTRPVATTTNARVNNDVATTTNDVDGPGGPIQEFQGHNRAPSLLDELTLEPAQPLREQQADDGQRPSQLASTTPSSPLDTQQHWNTLESMAEHAGISMLDWHLFNETDFNDLATSLECPVQRRVQLRQLHQALVRKGTQKHVPALGFTNLSMDAVEALRDQFGQLAGTAGTLTQEQTARLFEQLELQNSNVSAYDSTRHADHAMEQFFSDEIDVQNNNCISFDDIVTYIDSLHSEARHPTPDTTSLAAIPDSSNQSLWIAHICLIICAVAVFVLGFTYFDFILVPLAMAWFFTFLIGPIVDLLEQRPLVAFDQFYCQPKLRSAGKHGQQASSCCHAPAPMLYSDTKHQPEGTATSSSGIYADANPGSIFQNVCAKLCFWLHGLRETVSDLFLLGRIPHALAIMLSLLIFFGAIGAVAVVVGQEVVELAKDDEFQQKLEELMGDVGEGVGSLLGVDIHELKPLSTASATGQSSREVVKLSELNERYGSYQWRRLCILSFSSQNFR